MTTPIPGAGGPWTTGVSPTSDATPTGAKDSKRPAWRGQRPSSAWRSTRSTRWRRRCGSRRSARTSPSWSNWPTRRWPMRWNGSRAPAACWTWRRWPRRPSWRPACSDRRTPLSWPGSTSRSSSSRSIRERTCTTPSAPTSGTWPPWRSCPQVTSRWRCAPAATTRSTSGTGSPSSARWTSCSAWASRRPGRPTARRAPSGWPAASGCRSASRSRRATAPWPSWPPRCSR